MGCRKSRKEAAELRMLCKRLDIDRSGQISFDEFFTSMQDERMVSYMASVGLEIHDVECFFRMAANASSKHDQVDIDKFVEGCMSMKGNASGLDMQKSLFEMSKLQVKVQMMEEMLGGYIAEFSQVLRPLLEQQTSSTHKRL